MPPHGCPYGVGENFIGEGVEPQSGGAMGIEETSQPAVEQIGRDSGHEQPKRQEVGVVL